ncbi:hypothetical protein acsn021_17130 [Anaerocolumna cellulosilytica]|uniref:Beta-lactamase n=1 Tax=Anaerocolumna cellulosilytica TaxID=433286 RepID=A0A6S6QU33_9FIRM|nr:cyclic peptide export ABC transporter [Anaerocolumna cellulosilytica]MBB5194893.1 putative ATP-binding cassette transporter [Anaerocolumna cellulosilytica]BCJ94144.1 hypothetical protein acsn021_17130 [Anaerocolumna cellulosilytica]
MKKLLILLILITLLIPSSNVLAEDTEIGVTEYMNDLDSLVQKALNKSDTPGASIAIVTKDGIQFKTYGYADIADGIKVSEDTLFELGSMSKAFTALGILYLEQEGSLNLTDNIKEYIPWLTLNFVGDYKGQKIAGEVPVTIENVLYQTTGIPFQTIGNIPEGTSEDMLEKTIRTLDGINLDFYPGTKYSYATINYDILGLIIQKISGQSYESFVTEKILNPLGLNHTYLDKEQASQTGKFAKGYKTEFFSAREYAAPTYRGNTPAGYAISSANDMARWLGIQMGLIEIPETYKELIQKSHIGDNTVASSGEFYYAPGWSVHIRGESIVHGGSNPNYSSLIEINNEKNIGICILTNQNSNAANYVSENFFNILYQRDITKYKPDTYQYLDLIFSILCIGSLIFVVFFFILLVIAIKDIIKKIRIREKLRKAKVAGLLLAIPIMIFFGYCIYYLPNILLSRLPWKTVNIWGSRSVMYGSVATFFAGIIFFIYVLVTFNYPKKNEKNYFALIPLSILNGLTSALIIFTINESFNRNLEYSKELLIYFIFSLIFFVYTIKLVQGRLIVITNEMMYEKRMNMINKILSSSFQTIESVGVERIYSGLNNDIGAISKIPNIVVSFASNFLTVIFCIAYLLSNSFAAFVASISIIVLNFCVSIITSRIATKFWEQNRDIQDIYFGQMHDLVYGFKELVLSKLRKADFRSDMEEYSKKSRDLSTQADIKFLNFSIYNTLMFNIIFGIVVFVFPLFIIGIQVNDLRETLFMVFYLLGPFRVMMGFIPAITQVRINYNRINNLISDLENVSSKECKKITTVNLDKKKINIKFDNAFYSYIVKNEDTNEEGVEFTLGPVNMEMNTGEIIYITGGNGSGKSTLGRLLSGLYAPQSGSVKLNGEMCNRLDLNECFSAVFSDFHLFKKLYGVDISSNKHEIDELLKMMMLDKKVEMNEYGEFKSLNLSTGQKKRLAYIVCCLEDKPFMLFDEWAAEQDPEFRHYFYTELLPLLKQKGKGIIIITHDDRYFNLADKMIKLERGEIIENECSSTI